MKKSILSGILVMLMLLCPLALSAQKTNSGYHEWDILGQVHAGATMSNISGAGGDPCFAPTAGIGLEVLLNPNFGVEFQCNYNWLGSRNVDYTNVVVFSDGAPVAQNFETNVNLHYLNTMYLARWYFAKGWAAYTGLEYGTLLSAKAKAKALGDEGDIKDQLHGGRAGIPIGVTKNFGPWFLDARYTFNLNKLPDTDAAKMLFDDGGLVHALQFTVGYKFQMM